MLAHELVPRWHRRLIPGRVEHSGAVGLFTRFDPFGVPILLGMRHAGGAHQCGDVQILRVETAVRFTQFLIARNARAPRRIPGPAPSTFHWDTVAYRSMGGM